MIKPLAGALLLLLDDQGAIANEGASSPVPVGTDHIQKHWHDKDGFGSGLKSTWKAVVRPSFQFCHAGNLPVASFWSIPQQG